MSKTSFTKAELSKLHFILSKRRMLPCEKISVNIDVFNSGVENVYTIMNFLKGEKLLKIGLVTKTHPRTHKLEEQLINYFGGEEC